MKCPKCGNENLDFYAPQLASDGSFVNCDARCNDCNSEMNAHYIFTEFDLYANEEED